MSSRLVLLMLILWGFNSGKQVHAQSPVFLGEDLVFYLSDSLCVMRGVYHFLNPTETRVKTRLFYPFPVSDSLPFPDKVEVLSLDTGTHPLLLGSQNGVSFILEIEPLEESSFQVEYWQSAEHHFFEYILTSTQKWNRALEWASYEIHVPDHLRLEYCSLAVDTSWVEIEKTVYSIYRESYLPMKNFELRWGFIK